MMNLLIPMAGAGKRFALKGYRQHKPVIPTIDRRSGEALPMVVCAALDLPGIEEKENRLILIDRDFHRSDGVEEEIQKHIPRAEFITVDYLTEGQAITCLLAKERIDTGDPLLIAGCDNGMVFDREKFERMKADADCLVFTYRNNEAVLADPDAYGWVETGGDDSVIRVSVKKAISDNPISDHAVVAAFWFREGRIFVKAAQQMIAAKDQINGEFYVDQAINYVVGLGYTAKVFEIQRYLGWGTPRDYESYIQTISYWRRFVSDERYLAGKI